MGRGPLPADQAQQQARRPAPAQDAARGAHLPRRVARRVQGLRRDLDSPVAHQPPRRPEGEELRQHPEINIRCLVWLVGLHLRIAAEPSGWRVWNSRGKRPSEALSVKSTVWKQESGPGKLHSGDRIGNRALATLVQIYQESRTWHVHNKALPENFIR